MNVMSAEEVATARREAAARFETQQREAGARRKVAIAAAAAPRFRLTVTSPDGALTHDEVVARDERDERVAALWFVTEQLPGWKVAAEPIT